MMFIFYIYIKDIINEIFNNNLNESNESESNSSNDSDSSISLNDNTTKKVDKSVQTDFKDEFRILNRNRVSFKRRRKLSLKDMEVLIENNKEIDPWKNTTPTDNVGSSSITRSNSSESNQSEGGSESLSSSTETIKDYKRSNFDVDRSDYNDYFQ